ncbi:hypothetical protein OBBRIDRAFT_712434, partial [Obba rivulosa]
SGSNLDVGHGVDSCTSDILLSDQFILDGRRVRLIDTPGFDDSERSDADVLEQIAAFLIESYQKGNRLHGVLYLHRISDVRMGGAARRNFSIIHKLCGPAALPNMILATTRWNEVDLVTGEGREDDLRTKFFRSVLDGGAVLWRHDRALASAQAIIREFLKRDPSTLLIQHEIVIEGKTLSDTQAGLELHRDMSEEMERQK